MQPNRDCSHRFEKTPQNAKFWDVYDVVHRLQIKYNRRFDFTQDEQKQFFGKLFSEFDADENDGFRCADCAIDYYFELGGGCEYTWHLRSYKRFLSDEYKERLKSLHIQRKRSEL